VSRNTHKKLSGVAATLRTAAKELDLFLKEHDPDRDDAGKGKSIAQRRLALQAKLRIPSLYQ
jgi:hypothetical protein